MVESRDGTGISLKTAIMETVSVFARITPTNNAGIQSQSQPKF